MSTNAGSRPLFLEKIESRFLDLCCGVLLISDDDIETKAMIKAVDTLAAYIKCQEEEAAGNHEFSRAKKRFSLKF